MLKIFQTSEKNEADEEPAESVTQVRINEKRVISLYNSIVGCILRIYVKILLIKQKSNSKCGEGEELFCCTMTTSNK